MKVLYEKEKVNKNNINNNKIKIMTKIKEMLKFYMTRWIYNIA